MAAERGRKDGVRRKGRAQRSEITLIEGEMHMLVADEIKKRDFVHIASVISRWV